MPVRYTNSPEPSKYLVQTRVRTVRPYVSGHYQTQLSPKERLARQQERIASCGGFSGGGGSFGLNTAQSSGSNFFSPQLSTDFLELPQSLRELREWYQHFYNTDELVGQAIDLHTELPLSKVRLSAPKPRSCPKGFKSPENYGKYILSRFERMCKRIKLFQRLITMVHHYWLDGSAFCFAEDGSVDVPQEVGYDRRVETLAVLQDNGDAVEQEEEAWVERSTRETEELEFYQKNYQGWERLVVLPIDKVKVTTFDLADKTKVELIPSDRDRKLVEQAAAGDETALDIIQDIPDEILEYLTSNRLIPLGTDPDEGSFVYLLSGRKGASDELGQSILHRCHLPGTPVLVRRKGQVLEVPIEDLDPDIDQVATKEHNWRDFEHGLRMVSEEVCLLGVSKVHPQVACTKDHTYSVLRDGFVVEVKAGDIVPGDFLEIASLPLSETIREVSLEDVFGVPEEYVARRSGNSTELAFEIVDRTEDHFAVRYERGETRPRCLKRAEDVRAILDWASTLKEPAFKRSAELCERFSVHPVTLKEIRYQLARDHGYAPVVLKDKTLRFDPFTGEAPLPPKVSQTKSFQRRLALDGDLGYFIGYWLGDGWISRQPGLDYGCLGICYGSQEESSLLAIDLGVKPVLERIGAHWSESEMHAGVMGIFAYHDALVRWLASNFGHVCEDKCLPDWIFDAPKEFLWGLLRGLIDSDGDIVLKKAGTVSARISSANAILVSQLFLVATSLGLPVSKTKPAKERWMRMPQGELSFAKKCYAVHLSHGPSVGRLLESGFTAKGKLKGLLGGLWKDGRSGSRHQVHEGRLFYRVRSTETKHHIGPVFSLNVHEDHNFFVGLTNTKNCLRTLTYREKLRQAQTSIASRAMTPKRVVWAEGLSDADVDDLREQVDLSLVDPDYSIVANYEIRWEEMGARDRLLDLSVEYEQTERRLLAGLGVTESLMSGESLYSGDRLKLHVINQRYLHLREILQEYVDNYLFEPVARRMGFVEKDEWGQEVVLYPHLSFTRLPLRDDQEYFDAIYNLYQKGSIGIEYVLETLNIDPNDTKIKLEQDMFTVNDAVFNEVMRSVYGEVGRMLAEKTNILEKMAKYLELKIKPEPEGEEGGGRF